MKKICLCAAIILGIFFARMSHADELADLKAQQITTQEQLKAMGGYEALELLKSYDHTKEIPVIALSANAMPKDIARGKVAGFKDYITKPININKFLEVADNVLTTPLPRTKGAEDLTLFVKGGGVK